MKFAVNVATFLAGAFICVAGKVKSADPDRFYTYEDSRNICEHQAHRGCIQEWKRGKSFQLLMLAASAELSAYDTDILQCAIDMCGEV